MFREVLSMCLSYFWTWYLSNICLELMVRAHICQLVCVGSLVLVSGSLTVALTGLVTLA